MAPARYRRSRSFRLYDFLCRYASRTLAARARTITRMNANAYEGRCFPKRRIGGGQRANRGSLCARAARHAPLTLA